MTREHFEDHGKPGCTGEKTEKRLTLNRGEYLSPGTVVTGVDIYGLWRKTAIKIPTYAGSAALNCGT